MIGQTFSDGAYRSTSWNSTGLHKGNVNFDQRFNHQFIVGLRYAFDTAPPPPPPVAVVVPPRFSLHAPIWCSSIGTSRT